MHHLHEGVYVSAHLSADVCTYMSICIYIYIYIHIYTYIYIYISINAFQWVWKLVGSCLSKTLSQVRAWMVDWDRYDNGLLLDHGTFIELRVRI